MANIRTIKGKRGNTYNVQIRIRPYGNVTKTFKKKKAAERWAAQTEMEMREGRYGLVSEAHKKTLAVAIERYRKYVLPQVKKSRRDHIIDWWEQAIGQLALKEITPALITEIKDKLLHSEFDNKKMDSLKSIDLSSCPRSILFLSSVQWFLLYALLPGQNPQQIRMQ